MTNLDYDPYQVCPGGPPTTTNNRFEMLERMYLQSEEGRAALAIMARKACEAKGLTFTAEQSERFTNRLEALTALNRDFSFNSQADIDLIMVTFQSVTGFNLNMKEAFQAGVREANG